MKVYSIPEHLPAPKWEDYGFDFKKCEELEDAHRIKLTAWAKTNGYAGPRTGEIFRTGIADGYAQYMVCDGGRNSMLLHLPYGDGYHQPDVRFLPKAEIYRRIDQQKSARKLFGGQ